MCDSRSFVVIMQHFNVSCFIVSSSSHLSSDCNMISFKTHTSQLPSHRSMLKAPPVIYAGLTMGWQESPFAWLKNIIIWCGKAITSLDNVLIFEPHMLSETNTTEIPLIKRKQTNQLRTTRYHDRSSRGNNNLRMSASPQDHFLW
ncbi:hypothetical protein CEXT_541411 [Caerostris extrusa]|uniref:Ycf15 n=1 Tax=Caerostris extrusa TaxID=172846 RepID=A0AAV4XBZ0_CAEEX|nr:hypothetical protein CEXT_541411 [Caerostris extrusa]